MDARAVVMGRRGAYLTAAVILVGVVVVSIAAVISSRGPDGLPPVAFSVQTGYRVSDIGVATPEGSRLITDDQLSYAPAWSPDGTRIAFIRGEPDTWEECCGYGQERVWVMGGDGTNAQPVSDVFEGDDGPESSLQWEPGGQSILYVDARGDLTRLDVPTGSLSTVIEDFGCDRIGCIRSFGLSPDGTHVAAGLNRQTVITDLADGSEEVIANDVFGYGENVTWSPDGQWLVMTALARRVDDGGLWAWNLQDERALQVSATTWVTYTWVGPDDLLSCRQIDVQAGDGYDTDGRAGLLYVNDLGDGGDSVRVTGYDEVPVTFGDMEEPANPPGNCIGDEMNGRATLP
ncbi:MAG: hypothetical protein LH630_10340 [Actinomycetia bacterium]|nr:hypothetical protein [Actinomycetes bacterium]